jgi:hypothetical protein
MGRPKKANKPKQVYVPVKDKLKYTCVACNKERNEDEFYKNKKSSFVDRHLICKSCINGKLSDGVTTPRDVMKELDLPYIDSVWEECLTKQHPFGNYMRMISLPQYKGLGYADSDSAVVEVKEEKVKDVKNKPPKAKDLLVDEKKQYSREWLGYYTPTEIEYLDNYIADLRRDFKITNRNHVDYAKKIAKASLAMDLAFDNMMNNKGDSSKYKAMKDTFDSLSKTAQFSENQRGASDVGLGGFGVIFDKVEQNAYVYEHEPESQDIYDKLLEQFSNIKKSL